MLVSQYIYTACGKKKNGDFVVWAKSPDITEAEGEEIHQMMTYKNPAGVKLYDATEEEISAACPTKYAYFILSTGKKVLAESNFIGRVYSCASSYGQDVRWNNFFIHAYVFDGLGNALPMSFLGKGKFKRKLEYREWHDEPCPETLPQIELQPEAVNIREVEAFLTPERKRQLLPLLQTVINAAEGGSTVSFNDTEDNQKLWYTAIGMLLLPSLRENATFGSQVIPAHVYNVGGMTCAKPLAVRNISDSASSYTFNYAANAAMKQPVFDFRNNITVEVALDSFVTELGNALEKSLISALEYVKDIENLCSTYGCGREQAVAFYMLKNSRLQWFSGFDAYVSAVEAAEKCGMISASSAADCIYRAVFVNVQWQPEAVPLALLKKIYENGGSKIKDEMIAYYLTHLESYGVNSQDAVAYANAFYASAPFTAGEFLRYLADSNSFAAGFEAANGFRKNYLIYHTFLSEYEKLNVEFAYPVISAVFCYYATEKTYAQLDLLLSGAYSVKAELAEGLVRDFTDGLADAAGRTDMLFHLIEAVNAYTLQVDLLKKAVTANKSNPDFIVVYTERYNKNAVLYSALEKELVRDVSFAKIQTDRETYPFRMNRNVSRADLNTYFKKYCLNGSDCGLYYEKLTQYLNSKRDVKCCFDIYSDIRSTDINYGDMKRVYAYLQSKMYEPSVEEILKYSRQEVQLLEELDAKLASAGAEPAQKSVYTGFVRTVLSAAKDASAAAKLINLLKTSDVYASLTDSQKDEIISNYLSNLFDIYCTHRSAQGARADSDDNLRYENVCILSNMLYGLIQRAGFLNGFARACSRLASKNYLILMTDMFVLACGYPCICADELKKFTVKYFNALSNRKKAERLISDVLDNAPPTCKQSISEYSAQIFGGVPSAEAPEGGEKVKAKKSGGFFSQIFGFGKKNDEDPDD